MKMLAGAMAILAPLQGKFGLVDIIVVGHAHDL